MKRVYVAGPMSASTDAEVEANVMRAAEYAARIMAMGFDVFCPHLFYFIEKAGQAAEVPTPDYAGWLAIDFRELARCDLLFVVDRSPGTDLEIQEAGRLGIPVIWSLEHFI